MMEIRADAQSPSKPLVHFWNLCVGAGRANEGLRAGWQQQLRYAVEHCRFRYIRFHGLFHDDMFVYREENDTVIYNFQYIDDLFDALLDIGIRPFVEFGFCPRDLATEKATCFWWNAHGSPPKSLAKWLELVRRVARHWVDRYGIDEVASWYFEVWNEPNLHFFFKGSQTEYFRLYEVTARTLKTVSHRLRVGGPATSNFVPDTRFDGEHENTSKHTIVAEAEDLDALEWRPVWVEKFLNHCHSLNLPVDFVSAHPYPTDWALDGHGTGKQFTRGVDATRKDLATIRQLVNSGPYPNAEIHLTEWSSTSTPRDHSHDYPQAATYIVKANLESIGSVDSLSYWTFTDVFEESGAGDTIFHGGFGMINYQGIPKPSFHAYRMLAALGDELISSGPGSVVTRDSQTSRVTAIAYHFPPQVKLTPPKSAPTRDVAEKTLASGKPEKLSVHLTGLPPRAEFEIEILAPEHGNALRAWQKMGEPNPPNREQTAELKKLAAATLRETLQADKSGILNFSRTVQPWTVALIRQI